MLLAARGLRSNAANIRLKVNGVDHTGVYAERFDGETLVDSPVVIANAGTAAVQAVVTAVAAPAEPLPAGGDGFGIARTYYTLDGAEANVTQVTQNAAFDGANLLNGSIATNIQFLANADATNKITLTTQNMSLGGALITVAGAASISTVTFATGILAQLDASIGNVNQALGNLGSQSKQIEAHLGFISKLTDVLETGVGNLVDADLAKESARLQGLQVQQQLGAQALSIANQAPQIVLQLFRGG